MPKLFDLEHEYVINEMFDIPYNRVYDMVLSKNPCYLEKEEIIERPMPIGGGYRRYKFIGIPFPLYFHLL